MLTVGTNMRYKIESRSQGPFLLLFAGDFSCLSRKKKFSFWPHGWHRAWSNTAYVFQRLLISTTILNTSDLCGRNLKHSFPALRDCSCSSSLKKASARAWYVAVNIDRSWPGSERWMHMLRSMTAFLWLLLSAALRPRCSHSFGWPYKRWISIIVREVIQTLGSCKAPRCTL